jgi:hypothetical protein
MGFFIVKIYYISSSIVPNITHTKNHISDLVVSRTLRLECFTLKVLSVEKIEEPKITYSYLEPVERPDTFVWDNRGSWSRCSEECQGNLSVCVDLILDYVYTDSFP